jgi:hypothetical protein
VEELREFSETSVTLTGEYVTRRVTRWFVTLPRFVRVLWLLAAIEFLLIVPRLLV